MTRSARRAGARVRDVRRRSRCALPACGLLAVLAAPAAAVPAVGRPAPSARLPADDATAAVDRVVHDDRIRESSGLAASPLHPGVLWTFNDGGDPDLFAVGRDGTTTATVGVGKAGKENWEAVACVRGPRDTPMIAIGDVGDNDGSRASVDIVLVAEPRSLRDTSVLPDLVLRLRYPDGASDAETLLADPRTNRLYLVTKDGTGVVHAVPESAWPGTSGTVPDPSQGADAGAPPVRTGELERVAEVDLPMATDGTVLPDGRVVLRSKTDLVVLPAIETWTRGSVVRPLGTAGIPEQEQGESLTLSGSDLLVGSEGKEQPILRVGLPAGTDPVQDPGTGNTGRKPESSRWGDVATWGLGCAFLAGGLGVGFLRRRRSGSARAGRS